MKSKDFIKIKEAIPPIAPIEGEPIAGKQPTDVAGGSFSDPGDSGIQQSINRGQAKIQEPGALRKAGGYVTDKAVGGVNRAGSVASTLGSAFRAGLDHSVQSAVQASQTGRGSQAYTDAAGKIDQGVNPAEVADFLKKASQGRPVNPTGNPEIDKLLKNAGILLIK
jgi:hypothetical protein